VIYAYSSAPIISVHLLLFAVIFQHSLKDGNCIQPLFTNAIVDTRCSRSLTISVTLNQRCYVSWPKHGSQRPYQWTRYENLTEKNRTNIR